MQPVRLRHCGPRHHRFNPHPPGGVGATSGFYIYAGTEQGVSILTHLVGWVQLAGTDTWSQHAFAFQSSPTWWGGCNRRSGRLWARRESVSILTHLVGWVQPEVIDVTTFGNDSFQSSPTWWGGCNRVRDSVVDLYRLFSNTNPCCWWPPVGWVLVVSVGTVVFGDLS